MINRALKAAAAALLIAGLTAGCEVPEDDITEGKNAFSEKGNGAQTKKDAPKEEEKVDTGPQLTAGQENAIQSAQQYLSMSGFSRSGLIDQLTFEKFSEKDATYAVDHIKVNWNEQAARSAKEYLEMSSFSRGSLIEQLEFEGYTPEQAAYGATQNGL